MARLRARWTATTVLVALIGCGALDAALAADGGTARPPPSESPTGAGTSGPPAGAEVIDVPATPTRAGPASSVAVIGRPAVPRDFGPARTTPVRASQPRAPKRARTRDQDPGLRGALGPAIELRSPRVSVAAPQPAARGDRDADSPATAASPQPPASSQPDVGAGAGTSATPAPSPPLRGPVAPAAVVAGPVAPDGGHLRFWWLWALVAACALTLAALFGLSGGAAARRSLPRAGRAGGATRGPG